MELHVYSLMRRHGLYSGKCTIIPFEILSRHSAYQKQVEMCPEPIYSNSSFDVGIKFVRTAM